MNKVFSESKEIIARRQVFRESNKATEGASQRKSIYSRLHIKEPGGF